MKLAHRREAGDLDTIHEVWIDEIYRLPFPLHPEVVVDLGAHIGLASLWFATQYDALTVIAVEPNAENASLAKHNFDRNNVPGIVLEAAAAPVAGVGRFTATSRSNMGRLSTEGEPVELITMPQILELTPEGWIDLLKIDIEGGESALFSGPTDWLGHVGCIVAEFHPPVVDDLALVRFLVSSGFQHFRPGLPETNPGHFFLRQTSGGRADGCG